MTQDKNDNAYWEPLDLGKLRFIVRSRWKWIALIMLLTNGAAILYTRYTKDLYESESEIKLDVKQDASELGIRELIPDRQQANLIASEIETIKSKLFLNTVIDSLKLDVTYLSMGKILNTDLHRQAPFSVVYHIKNPSLFNQPILIEQQANGHY